MMYDGKRGGIAKKHYEDVPSLKKRFGAIAFILLATFGLTTISQSALAQQTTNEATDETAASFRETQQTSMQYLTTDEQTAGSTKYTSRWSPVIATDPGTLTAIFADCEPGEFAVSHQQLFESRNIELVHSLAVTFPDNFMAWLGIVFNWGDEPLDASIGVVCSDDSGKADTIAGIDYNTKLVINNAVNQIIRQQGSINIQYISLVYQKITQNAIQIVNITGNNNTVTQVINQSASQIIASNATTPEQIDQIVNQTAQQAGIETTRPEETLPQQQTGTTGTNGTNTTTIPLQQGPINQSQALADEPEGVNDPNPVTPPGAPPSGIGGQSAEEEETTTEEETITTEEEEEETTTTEEETIPGNDGGDETGDGDGDAA